VVSLVTSRRIRFAEGVSSEYQFAPIFLIRMAGVPFEPIEQLATTVTSAAARELLVRQTEVAALKLKVENFLRNRGHDLSKELFRAWKKALRSGASPPAEPRIDPFNRLREAASNLAIAENNLREELQIELHTARGVLLQSAKTILPDYLVFANPETNARLTGEWSVGEPPPRNKAARARERHLLLYIQRVCAKNDSLSAFGPEGWGKIDNQLAGIRFSPEPGITQRETFLERWTAHGAAAALNADPEIRAEFAPRIDPNGRLDGDKFIFAATEEVRELDSETATVLRHCDGTTPAHSLDVELRILEWLAQQKMIRWEVEVPAMQPRAFDILVSDVAHWRDDTSRQRWLPLLESIAALPAKFGKARQTVDRIQIMNEAHSRLDQLGARHAASNRFLYAATNPICEECFRESHFCIGKGLIEEVTTDAAPWIDLWRDCYAFIASRVAAGLRQIFDDAKRDTIPLPAFLRLCETSKLPLTGPGLVALAHIAFQEVKVAFREQVRAHADEAEYELTAADCHFVRQNFEYDKFDEYTYPSADLQLAAKSADAVARGEYQWILAELHPPVALLHHGFYWSCPDKAALSEALASTVFGKPSFHFGFFAADFTATTTVRYLDAMRDLTHFLAPQRSSADWRTTSPSDAEVYLDPATGDVCLRKIDNHEYLGSFARAWLIPLGFHPFQFGMAPHMPRLRCGKVVVQRRAWTITLGELGPGDFTGVSRALVLAVEQLRARRDLPRFVYIRPTEQALRRSGAEGRDKDTKPVFVDLESYLFLEIFHRWLTKAGELEITEMLPAPDDLLWREPDGRRTFELRTLIVPRS
jgi:hypothetical protein